MHILPFFRPKAPSVTPEQLSALLAERRPVVLVDIRCEKEFEAGHLPGAIHIPLADVEARAAELDPTAFIVFY